MAANTFTNVIPLIMAKGLGVLRRQTQMPQLVYSDFADEVAEFGNVIRIPVIDDATVVAVTPAMFAPASVAISPTKVDLNLDWWRECSFSMSDKEMHEAISGVLPLRAEAALYALGRAVDDKLLALYKDVGNMGGVAGTTPFGTTATAFLDARIGLNAANCPADGRNVVLGHVAEGNALGYPNFVQADQRGDQGGIVGGYIGRKYGAEFYMNQGVVTHTMTTAIPATAALAAAISTGATEFILSVTIVTDYGLAAGDLFHMTGDAVYEGYAVVTAMDLASTVTGATLVFTPPARRSYATTIIVTGVATHVPNLYFHPRAFAWASRPLTRSQFSADLGSIFFQAADPGSGLAVRLEVTRQWKQTVWTWDILGGAITVRNELAARLLG